MLRDVMVSPIASDNSFVVTMKTLYLISTIIIFGQIVHLYENIFLLLTSKNFFFTQQLLLFDCRHRCVPFIEKIKISLVFLSAVCFACYTLLLF